MGVVGADLETLRGLYREFQTQSGNVEELKRALKTSMENTQWEGANASKFKDAFETFTPKLTELGTVLQDASTTVKEQGNNIAAATGEPPIG